MTADEMRSLWKARSQAIGQAQARYLWLLLLFGIFFWSIRAPIEGSYATVPIVGIQLDVEVLRASGPIVIFLLIVATFGTLRAHGEALRELGVPRDPKVAPSPAQSIFAEAADSSPNPLDFAAYTRRKWTGLPWALLLLNYPLYFAIFAVEATFLWLTSLGVKPLTLDLVFLAILGGILGAVAFIQIGWLFKARFQRITAIDKKARTEGKEPAPAKPPTRRKAKRGA